MIQLTTVTPRKGTPTHQGIGKKDTINGVKVWLKGESPTGCDHNRSPYNERAAYLVSDVLKINLVPPTILYLVEGKVVSAMKWVVGNAPYDSRPALLKMFDYIIENSDRHQLNWLVKPSGNVWAIDNAYSFRTYSIWDFSCDGNLPDRVLKAMRKALKNKREIHRLLDTLVGKSEVASMLKRMKKVLVAYKERRRQRQ